MFGTSSRCFRKPYLSFGNMLGNHYFHPSKRGWLSGSRDMETKMGLVYLPGFTLPETNMAPKNRASQKESHLPTIHF